MSLTTPDNIRTLQRKLYLKAKAEQDPSRRHSASCLRTGACQQGRAGRRWRELRGDRSGGAGELAGRHRDGIANQGVSAPTGATGADPEAWRRRATTRHPDDPRPGGADRGETGAGADLRGGPRTHCLWLPTRPQRHRCGQGGAPTAVPGVHRCGGRRPVEVYDPARRTASIGRGADRRSPCPAPDQIVAQDTGRGNGPGWTAAYERRPNGAPAARRRAG